MILFSDTGIQFLFCESCKILTFTLNQHCRYRRRPALIYAPAEVATNMAPDADAEEEADEVVDDLDQRLVEDYGPEWAAFKASLLTKDAEDKECNNLVNRQQGSLGSVI